MDWGTALLFAVGLIILISAVKGAIKYFMSDMGKKHIKSIFSQLNGGNQDEKKM